MNIADLVGYIATILAIVTFLPQVVKTWRTKQTKDLSLHSYLLLATAAFLWAVYGFLISSIPVLVTNIIVCISAVSLVILKVKHG